MGAARLPGGVEGLACHLELTPNEVGHLVALAMAAIPPESSFAPEDVMEVSLGALDADEEAAPDDEPVSFAPLPAEIDLRDRMPAVRDQQNRSTCAAHACVAVREFLMDEASTEGDLSEQCLYWA